MLTTAGTSQRHPGNSENSPKSPIINTLPPENHQKTKQVQSLMKDTLSNKLASFVATLAVADTPSHRPIWENQTPLSFTEELALARAGVTALGSAGAEQSTSITGTAEALRKLRTSFEEQLHILARATYQFMKKAGRIEDAAKVDFTPSAYHDARAVSLAGIGEIVLDLAEPLTLPPAPGQAAPGEKHGITAALYAQVDNLWERYSTAVGAPTGARSRRKALTTGLPGKFNAVEDQSSDLDDLVIQFGTTEIGKEFIDAWFNARHVSQLGRRSAKPIGPTPSVNPIP